MTQSIPEPTLRKIRRIGKILNALSLVSPALAGKAAFRVFCTPRRLPLRGNDRDFLAKAQQESLRSTVQEGMLGIEEWMLGDPSGCVVVVASY